MDNIEKNLQSTVDQLTQRGVKDIKFFFGATSDKSVTNIAEDVDTVLRATLNESLSVPMPAFGDSKGLKS